MRRAVPALATAVLLAVAVCAGPASAGPPSGAPASGAEARSEPAPFGRPYAVRDLALPPGATASSAAAVNATGVIAGEVTIGGARRAVIWDAAGRVKDLGAPSGGQAWAVDVADTGWVAGTATGKDGTTWPWVWRGRGGLQRLDGLPDFPAEAVALNRSGQVVVRVDDGEKDEYGWPASTSAWLWTPGGGARRLPDLGGPRTKPLALNDAGQAVGTSTVDDDWRPELVYWDPRRTDVIDVTGPTTVDVLTLADAELDQAGTVAAKYFGYGPEGTEGDWTFAWNPRTGFFDGSHAWVAVGGDAGAAINERNQVTTKASHSSCEEPYDDCGDQATIWTLGRQPAYLPVGRRYSSGRDVNDLGEVAGTNGVAARWVYDGRFVHDLPGSLPPGYEPAVSTMNEAGLVVGHTSSGDQRRATAWVAPGGSVSVSVPAVADTYVHPALPTTSFGSDASLAGGGVDGYLGLLRFVVPRAPAGRTLVAARLHLQTGSQSFAGSRDTHVLRLVAGTWTERTTWTTRPALGAELTRSVVGATGPNTSVAAYLDVRQLHAGRTLDLAISAGGRDSLWWASREAAPNLRPRLELIYR